VIGFPSLEFEQIPKAFVELKASYENIISELDVEKFVNEKIAFEEQLRGGVVFLDKNPKNFSGED